MRYTCRVEKFEKVRVVVGGIAIDHGRNGIQEKRMRLESERILNHFARLGAHYLLHTRASISGGQSAIEDRAYEFLEKGGEFRDVNIIA